MRFRILGPLEVWDEDVEVSLGGPKPRALLAVLLLHPNEVVPADRLIDELWGEDSPERAAGALRVNVSRLRKALPPDTLTTRSPGYVIRVEPDDLDLHLFERLVDEARGLRARGLAADAAERLREALSLWRGPALADFAYESFAQAAIARLEEIRLAALELRIDADLALGRHDELVGELEALVAEEPLRERLCGHLMTALYRSGRQAEALSAYRDARQALVDELGIEPGTELQELERAILRHEPALNLPATEPAKVREAAERSILVAILHEARVDALLTVAEPLARHPPRTLILARLVPDAGELQSASAWLEGRRSALEARRVVARAASFTSTAPGEELARLAGDLDVDLLLADAPEELLAEGAPDEQLTACSGRHPATSRCSLLVTRCRRAPSWFRSEAPSTTGRRSSSAPGGRARTGCRSGSRVPPRRRSTAGATRVACFRTARWRSNGSLASRPSPCSQRRARRACWRRAVTPACSSSGLSTRWHHEGLGPARLRLAREATPPTLLVRRGLRPGGLAPPPALTRFTWSIRP